eukprot:m.48243 g.48243  ORF g.48243 m.48243 type:complete len:108 (-) comp11353_c0_seq2:139-462(-)
MRFAGCSRGALYFVLLAFMRGEWRRVTFVRVFSFSLDFKLALQYSLHLDGLVYSSKRRFQLVNLTQGLLAECSRLTDTRCQLCCSHCACLFWSFSIKVEFASLQDFQ